MSNLPRIDTINENDYIEGRDYVSRVDPGTQFFQGNSDAWDLEDEDQPWTPGFGRPYFKERQYYSNPTVKEVGGPSHRGAVPNSRYKQQKFLHTDDDVVSIFAKPLGDEAPSSEEINSINSGEREFLNVLHYTNNSPCVCHLKNMYLDRCRTPGLSGSNKTMPQWQACVSHFYRFQKCVAKHEQWFESRYTKLKAGTGYQRPGGEPNLVDPQHKRPEDYPEFQGL
uniref:Uncharacterized protein n=1 Tax=Percolomonas cosmopolitus TaxID=63605 RepID=A0A7S1PFB4_9EUKA